MSIPSYKHLRWLCLLTLPMQAVEASTVPAQEEQPPPSFKKALESACRSGHAGIVSLLLEKKPEDLDLNLSIYAPPTGYRNNFNCLDIACYHGHVALAEILLARDDIDPNQDNTSFRVVSPLELACREGHAGIVPLLLENPRFDPTQLQDDRPSPCKLACQEGHQDTAIALLQHDKGLGPRQEITISRVITTSRTEIVKSYPLHIACEYDCPQVVDHLLANGADPDQEDNRRKTPLAYAGETTLPILLAHEHLNPNQVVKIHEEIYNHTRCSISSSQIRPTKESCGNIGCFSVNARVLTSPLHIACRHNLFGNVRGLIERGANPWQQDSIGYTPLDVATPEVQAYLRTLEDDGAMACFLKNIGNEPLNRDGWAPFHYASCNGHEDIVKMLLQDERVDVNLADSKGWAPFHYASYNGHEGIVKMLLEDERVDVNQRTNIGGSALHLACKGTGDDVRAVVYMLLANEHMDVNLADNKGWTSLHYVCNNRYRQESENLQAVQQLCEYRDIIPTLRSTDRNSVTPLDLAQRRGYTDVVAYLEQVPINLNEGKKSF